jgi:hypothetical protein
VAAVAVHIQQVTVYTLNPLEDHRWSDFVGQHPHGSIFHTVAWLQALQRTYGYEPVVYTTTPPDASLANGIVFCRVRSWVTGRRMVSLPFSDHCEPLVDSESDRRALFLHLQGAARRERWRYVEIRQVSSRSGAEAFASQNGFAFHVLNLAPPLDDLFAALHPSSVQRRIRRAERERLDYEEGNAARLIEQFYHLMLLTRRRHGLVPQPLEWFQNLAASLPSQLRIRVVSKRGTPVASVLTLSHRDQVTYKYGCSDARFHAIGAMPFLLWTVIRDAKACGMRALDLGRSDPDNAGLVRFKDRFGAARSYLEYLRHPVDPGRSLQWLRPPMKRVVSRLPDRVMALAGNRLYGHFG